MNKPVVSKKVLADICFIGLYGAAMVVLFRKIQQELKTTEQKLLYRLATYKVTADHYGYAFKFTLVSSFTATLDDLVDCGLDKTLSEHTRKELLELTKERKEFLNIIKKVLSPCNTVQQVLQIFPKEIKEYGDIDLVALPMESYTHIPMGTIDLEAQDRFKQIVLECHLKYKSVFQSGTQQKLYEAII